MQLKSIFSYASLILLPLLSAFAYGGETPDLNRNAIFASPVTMIVNSGMLDYPVISIAYERCLTDAGVSAFIPLHAGYTENENEKDIAFGSGLGVRKYFGRAFSGTYLTVQSDYIKSYVRRNEYTYNNGFDSNGNPLPGTYAPKVTRDYLSISQLSFGYKWAWRQFTLDLSGGGAFYAQDKDKYTNFIASANVGFPFGAGTFGL